MPKIIFTSMYHKAFGERGKLLSYMGTREGVEKLISPLSRTKPPTNAQEKLIESLVKKSPESKDYAEYKEYISRPSRASASDFIEEFAERNADRLTDLRCLVSYMAQRPSVQKVGSHGLFSQYDEEIDLKKVCNEVNDHKGIIWTHVVSLRREDAERLGYNNAETWKQLVRRNLNTIAEAHRIDVSKLRWYAAFHNTTHHPHIHLMVFSDDACQGFLTNAGIENMRREFANDIFRNEMYHIYKLKSELRQKLKGEANEVIEKYLAQTKKSRPQNDDVIMLFKLLAKKLFIQNGKKTYGYLPRSVKKIVEDITAKLAEDKSISSLYEEWCKLDDMASQTYAYKPKKRIPLERNDTFRSIKNEIIGTALKMCDVPFENQDRKTEISSAICSLIESLGELIVKKYQAKCSQKRMQIDRKRLEKAADIGLHISLEDYSYNEGEQNYISY